MKHAKHGAIAAVNMTTHVPDWKEPLAEQDDTFDVNLIFDFQKLRKDKKFINLGLTMFPELKKKYKLANIENTNLRKSDITIIADTLEHTEQPEKILNNIISSTKKIGSSRNGCTYYIRVWSMVTKRS